MLGPATIGVRRVFLVTLLWIAGDVWAQLEGDPAMMPQPDFSVPDHDRAVVVKVIFNSATDVVADGVIVSNRRARGSLGNPPLIQLEMLDANDNVIGEQFEWHPLWTTEWDDEGNESAPVDDSGTGTFYIPFDQDLVSVRINDVRRDIELVTVDVSSPVDAYCASVPMPVICSMLKDGFE